MRSFWRRRFRRSTMWLALFIGILAGLGLSCTGKELYFAPVLLAPMLIVAIRKQTILALLLIVLFGISCGRERGLAYSSKLAAYKMLYDQKVVLSVTAKEDAIYNKYKQLNFTAGNVTLENGQKLVGRMQISGFGANAVFQGDDIEVFGKLRPGYGIYQGSMSFASLKVVAHHPTLVSEIRRKFIAGMQSSLPEPLAPFAMGLLVGQRATLPEDIKQDLLMVGLTHIIAVYGYNLTIILQASRRLLGRKSKRVSTLLSVGLIGVFLLIAGASASIVRAAIVSMLSILTAYYGRSFKPLNLIFLAAVITAWANPVYIWRDLSWYLSFLAFFGVMVLSPIIQSRWPGRWHKSLLAGAALESVCAEIMTLPFVLHIFGQMSRVGLVANVLVVTLIPLAMLLSLIAGLAGMLASGIAGWFAWPAMILLNYMLDVAHLLAGLPKIFVEGIGLSLLQMLLLYGCVVLLAAILWKKAGSDVTITDMTEQKTGSLLA